MKKLSYITADIYSAAAIAMMWAAAIATLLTDSSNKIGLYVCLPLAFVFATLKNKGFRLNIYEKLLYALLAWDCASFLWAGDKEACATELHAMLGVFLLTYVISILSREKKLLPYLYFTFVLLYLSAWYYAWRHLLAFTWISDFRLNDLRLNANTMAYYTFYVSYLAFILSEITHRKQLRQTWTWAFWLMLPVSFAVAILTASRQVMVVQVPLYALLIYIRYVKGVSRRRKAILAAVAVVVIAAVAGPAMRTYNSSYLKTRSQTEIVDDPRADLAADALQLGMENMPLGLGGGNFQTVSSRREIAHNSYLEAFSDLGIPGVALYLALMLVFTIRQWERYRKSSDKMYFAFLTFGLIYMLDSLFFVFYNAIWLISFFMLVAAHSETYHNELTIETEDAA